MTQYKNIRDFMLPADLIAFGGRGRSSRIIKRFTRSDVSHVGLVRHVQIVADNTSRYFNEIVESTTLLDGVAGVTTSRLSHRVERYDGQIWWLPMSRAARSLFNATSYWNWLYAQDGKEYDMPQALRSGFDFLERIGVGVNKEDFGKLFCSELGSGALRASGVVKIANCSEETPIQLCQRPIWDAPVQLIGEPLFLRL